MTLLTFEVLPRGEHGWTSGVLTFGKSTTLLLGGNGAGKTPIMHALAFALGQPVQLPQLVRDKCSGVRLVLESGKQRWSLERTFDQAGAVAHDGEKVHVLQGDKELAEFLLPKLGMQLRSLAGKSGHVVPPYASVVGPIFVVDQDHGWLHWYAPHEAHQFIKNQREEVLRWVLDLPPRNRVVDKSAFETAQVSLGSIQQQIRITRATLSTLDTALNADRGADTMRQLVARKEALAAEFRVAHAAVHSRERDDENGEESDVRLRLVAEAQQAMTFKLVSLRRRRNQLAEVHTEVGAEIGALEENETAADVFRAFCGNVACQLFRKPEESYGRRVLYLKDQLKDFESSGGEIDREISLLEEQMLAAQGELAALANERRVRSASSEAAAALERLQALSREATSLQSRIDAIARSEALRSSLEELLAREQRAAEAVAELQPTRSPRKPLGRSLDARAQLALNFKEWITALRTQNIPSEAEVDEELRLVLGGEAFGTNSSQSGSTRTRIVLGFHAAVLETSIGMDGCHPPLLILDAPRQHELSAADLRTFVERFYALAGDVDTTPLQLVFSASDAEVVPDGCIDSLWQPQFQVENGLRFLGPAASTRIASVVPRAG